MLVTRQITSFPGSAKLFRPVLLLLLAVFSGCKKKEEAVPKAEVFVQAVHPTFAPISDEISADAVLAPLAQAAISPKITAPVHRFLVQRGSRVKAGQLLATLENADLKAAALDNQGALTAAKGSYETATRSTVPEEATKARLDLQQALANLELNRKIVASRQNLVTQGALPGRDLDTAQATLIQSQAAVDLATEHLAAVQKYANQAAIETAKGQLTSAQGKYQGAEAQVNYTEIRSPIAGVVTDRPFFAGETPAAGTALITVMDTSALLAKLHIAQREAQQLKVGAEATLTIPGTDAAVPARVSLISPALDPGSTTVEVWLRLANPNGIYKPGTSVHATITGHTVRNALVIPADAVQTAPDGTSSVMLLGNDNLAHKKPVTLGIATDKSVQLTDGLTTADQVITSGAYGLDDGTAVKIGTPPVEADKKGAGDDK